MTARQADILANLAQEKDIFVTYFEITALRIESDIDPISLRFSAEEKHNGQDNRYWRSVWNRRLQFFALRVNPAIRGVPKPNLY